MGQDIRRKTPVEIPERMGVKFTPCKVIKNGLNRPPKEEEDQ
jgi:nucleoid DNA-binding protein